VSIVVRGMPVHCEAQAVVDLSVFPARQQRTETRAVVWHWTGGQGDHARVIETLHLRGLSVNFIIGRDGVVYQCCDADRMTAHAGGKHAVLSANPWSVGVEVCGLGGDGEWWTEPQLAAGKALMRTLSAAFGLPEHAHPSERTLSRPTLETVRGHIGHFHVASNKRDPGPQWLAAICPSRSTVTPCEDGP